MCNGHRGIELRVGDIERAAEVLDVVGMVVGWHGQVDEAAGDGCRREGAVEDVDVTQFEVSRVEAIAARGHADGEARPDVPRHTDDVLRCRAAGAIPRGDPARYRIEDELGRRRRSAARRSYLEVRRAVPHHARRQRARYVHGLRVRVEYDGSATHVAADELRRACPVVGDPEGTTGTGRDAPRVDQERVEHGREAR